MLNRQAAFRVDGTLTDVPSAETEAPPVVQLNMFAKIDKEAFDRRASDRKAFSFSLSVQLESLKAKADNGILFEERKNENNRSR